ncbi:MAG: response regulator transcription factor [Acidobacteria bacterium]|jgi:two-component system, OmpR family, alkaline phosphatase synthesis response regulator PhoP|nr:response regulator transcription factor [Acidobacteriota bacterium]
MSRLLIVEDEPHIASGLRFNLEAEGHEVLVVEDGEAALRLIVEQPTLIDAMILDIMLPGMDGFAVAAALRARAWLHPILMLTARGRAEDVLRGFEAGADDYLPKPFDLSILVARLHALLRRQGWKLAPPPPDEFTFAGKTVDFAAQELRVGAEVHPLTLMETNLLRYLVRHDGQTVSRKRLLEEVWNVREDTDTRAIDHFMSRLRKYVEPAPDQPKHLLTVRGVGYRFESSPGSKAP